MCWFYLKIYENVSVSWAGRSYSVPIHCSWYEEGEIMGIEIRRLGLRSVCSAPQHSSLCP